MLTMHMTTYSRFQNGLLPRAVESVLSQDYDDFEFVICDDCSVDGTSEYLRGLIERDHRVRVFRNERNVNSVAISLGWCFANSDPGRRYVSWMFDDCVLLPGSLKLLANRARQTLPDVLFGVTDVKLPGNGVLKVGAGSADELREGVKTSPLLIPNGGILVDRRVFSRVGWYDPSIILRRSCDWDLFRRILTEDVVLDVIPEVLVVEEGSLQTDSLRNSFTTTFEIMQRYVAARDATGLHLDLQSCLTIPIDWIPPAKWSPGELAMIQYMFIEYFLSIGEVARALPWAKRLETSLPSPALTIRNLRRASETGRDTTRLLAAGAYAAAVAATYKSRVENESVAQ
jgi:glycosyltransferase involved in cell wall biosynthesis